MLPRSRARLTIALMIALLPTAAAQTLPIPSGELPTAPSEPPVVPDDPASALPSQGPLDIREDGLIFQGDATRPSYVRIQAPDGTPVLEYTLDDTGRARLDIGGTNAISDATLLRVDGDPTGDAFTLYLRDPQGDTHEARIDRAALAANVAFPDDLPLPVVDLLRPPAWPGAPSKPYFLFVDDSEPNHVAAAKLDGTPYLKRTGTHSAVIQIPQADADFDRIVLRASTGEVSTDATFSLLRTTSDAMIYQADLLPNLLGVQDAGTIILQPYYERRISPLIVERFPEELSYSYRVDGTGPTVTMSAPASANDFTFTVSWSGTDALSGIGGFTVDYRQEGATQWVRWLTKTVASSAAFSGDWGRTYEFRAMALDKVGNPSTPATGKTTVATRPGTSDDINDPPSARFLTPRTGSHVAGLTTVTWLASDPDGTAVTSKLELSTDEGATWRVLYSGPAQRADWDTSSEADGPGYRLRLTVTDGTQQAADVLGALTVRNVIAPPAASGTSPTPATPDAPSQAPALPDAVKPAASDADGTAPPTGPGADEAKKKGIPGPFVGIAILGAALLMGRRQS